MRPCPFEFGNDIETCRKDVPESEQGCGRDNASEDDSDEVVLAPLVYESSDDEDAPAAEHGVNLPRCVEFWKDIAPQKVLELMQANEKHGHSRRRLAETQAPPPSPAVAPVRRLSEAAAKAQLDAIIGGSAGDPGEPAIVEGLAEGWRAQERWASAEAFKEYYGDMPLKVHEIMSVSGMGKGTELWLPARDYIDYALRATVDAPFYVFQKKFIDGQHDELWQDYQCPPLFRDDLLDLTPRLRADFQQNRFFCLGGERTGSALHVDPHFTGAWNTLLCGEKRWVLFPPDAPPEEIGVPSDLYDKLRTPCAYWWHDWYPRLVAPEGAGMRLGMREVVQQAGETIYVPAGWWHTVLNLGWTIAVTENQLSPQSLPRAWPLLRQDRRRAGRLVRALRQRRPELLGLIDVVKDDAGDSSSSEEQEEEEFRMW